MSDEGREPTPEEFAEAMARRLGQVPVRDVVLQSMATFTDLAAIRLGLGPEGEARLDLSQARLAIEALRALIGVADAELGPAQAHPFREPLAALQMGYARAAEAQARAEEEAQAGEAGRLWTPPGTGPEEGGAGGRLWTPGS